MTDHSVREMDIAGGSTITRLSDDFRRVVERLQARLDGVALDAVDAERLSTVDEAEQAVDNLALELRRGTGNRGDWQGALVDYESAWLKIIRNVRDSDN